MTDGQTTNALPGLLSEPKIEKYTYIFQCLFEGKLTMKLYPEVTK